jgi:ABC-type transport system substrate-binding protein
MKVCGGVMIKSLIWLLLGVGCAVSQPTPSTLTLSRVGDFDGFNPFFSKEGYFQSASYSDVSLLQFSPATRRLELNHAVSIKRHQDAFVINLRPGWRWSDGSEIVADDYTTACQILSNMKLQVPNGHHLFMGKQGHTTCQTITRFTLKITVPEVNPHTEFMLAYIKPVPSKIFAPIADDAVALKKLWQRPEGVIVAGPYRPVQWDNNQAVFEKNRYYRFANPKAFDQIIVKIYRDRSQQRFMDFLAGKFDMMLLEDVSRVNAVGNEVRKLESDQSYNLEFITFNWQHPVFGRLFASKHFRLGMAALINRQSFKKEIPGQVVNTHLYPVYDNWKASVESIKFDPTLAAEHFRAAGMKKSARGWIWDNRLVEFPIMFNESNGIRKILAFAISRNARALGLNLLPKSVPDELWAQEVFERTSTFASLLSDLGGGNPAFPFDQEAYTCSGRLWLHQKTGQCQQDWEKEVNHEAQLGNSSLDAEVRLKAAHRIQRIMRAELPSIPLISKRWVFLARANLAGFFPEQQRNGLVGAGDLTKLWLEPKP